MGGGRVGIWCQGTKLYAAYMLYNRWKLLQWAYSSLLSNAEKHHLVAMRFKVKVREVFLEVALRLQDSLVSPKKLSKSLSLDNTEC